PANDNFLNAVQLNGSGTNQTGTLLSGKVDDLKGNIGATREQPINYGIFSGADQIELNHASQNGGKSVWYYWTRPSTGTGSMCMGSPAAPGRRIQQWPSESMSVFFPQRLARIHRATLQIFAGMIEIRAAISCCTLRASIS